MPAQGGFSGMIVVTKCVEIGTYQVYKSCAKSWIFTKRCRLKLPNRIMLLVGDKQAVLKHCHCKKLNVI